MKQLQQETFLKTIFQCFKNFYLGIIEINIQISTEWENDDLLTFILCLFKEVNDVLSLLPFSRFW